MECLVRHNSGEMLPALREQIVTRVTSGLGVLSCKIRYVIVSIESSDTDSSHFRCRIQLLRDGFDLIDTVVSRKTFWTAFDTCLKRTQRSFVNRIRRAALYKLSSPQPIRAYLDVMYGARRA